MPELNDYLSIEGECWLDKDHPLGEGRKWDQCCCVCKFLLTDYWYCRRMPEELKTEGHCGCDVVRGYICTAGEIHEGKSGQSGWPHHSIGCECFTKRVGRTGAFYSPKDTENASS